MKNELFDELLGAANEILEGERAKPIDSFSGKYRFLSNFYPSTLLFGDEGYANAQTVEHAYQASKTDLISEQQAVLNCPSAARAKKLGQMVTLRKDWTDEMKILTMRNLVLDKFLYNDILTGKLLGTGDAELIEGNTWGDTFWGVCDGKGENWLGKILMDVRTELQRRYDQSIGFGVR
jgi:ribA/ribD-fused uncharacterized protein